MDGPWFVGDQYLHVQAWEADFSPGTIKVTSTAVWIRLEHLPIEYYCHKFLKHVGNKIGKHLKIDAITNSATGGRFARICVQINHNKSLPKRFKKGTFWQDIVYENVPLLCYKCGRIGHKESICSEPNITLNQTPNTGSASYGVVTSNSETNQPQAPWKIVQTRRTRVRGIGQCEYPLKSKNPSDSYPPNHKVNFKQTSNTFQALQVDENDMVAPTDSAETGTR